jgi:hypothetical protein
MALPRDITFALCGSFADRRNRIFPNFRRLSPDLLERPLANGFVLDQVDYGIPAVSSEDFAIWIKPSSDNLVTHNVDLTQGVWEKGGNLTIRADRFPAPNSTFNADGVVWLSGSGNTQVLGRNFSLAQGATYSLRALLMAPVGSQFGRNDVIRFSGAIVGTPTYRLSSLSAPEVLGQYQIVDISFTTTGVASISNLVVTPNTISAVTASTVTIALASRTANDLAGGSISFSHAPTVVYDIAGNTATSGGNITITVVGSTLVSDGVTTSVTATLGQPTSKVVRFETYVESTASLVWGGLFLERSPFPIAFNYQLGTRNPLAQTEVLYQPKDNPITDVTSFGCFADIKAWRGDGNIANFGNFRLFISNGRLTAQIGAVMIADPDALPTSAKIYVQVSEGTASSSIFVNGILKARGSTPNFRGNSGQPLTLTSEGVRAYRSLWCTNITQSDGTPIIGGVATGDAGLAFSSEVIGQDLISTQNASIVLNPVTIPAFSGSDGQVFVRFPWVPIDTQTISAISTNTLSVSSALSFTPGVAFIQTASGAVITEVVVVSTNTSNNPNTITVASATGLAVGHTIAQPFSQTLVLPTNYMASTVEAITGVRSGELGKAENGVIYSNKNTQPVTVTPKITLAL